MSVVKVRAADVRPGDVLVEGDGAALEVTRVDDMGCGIVFISFARFGSLPAPSLTIGRDRLVRKLEVDRVEGKVERD